MDMEKNAMYHLQVGLTVSSDPQSMLRNKQFFTVTDYVEFINQNITNTV